MTQLYQKCCGCGFDKYMQYNFKFTYFSHAYKYIWHQGRSQDVPLGGPSDCFYGEMFMTGTYQ